MKSYRTIYDSTSISELFKNLERQKEIAVSIRYIDKRLPGILVFNYKASDEPLVFCSNEVTGLENGDIIEISFFYKDTFFAFDTRVIDASEKSFYFMKPQTVNASFGRSSTRYLIKKEENVYIKVNEKNYNFKVIDISTSGLSFESSTDFISTDGILRNTLLNIDETHYVYFDAIVKYKKQFKSAFVYGLQFINPDWETSQVVFNYIFERTFPHLKPLSNYMENGNLELCSKSIYSDQRIIGDQKSKFGNEIRKFEKLINKPSISINLAYEKNGKVSGISSALRIYERTFFWYPPVLLPETYLNPKANVDIFIGLVEHMLVHPYFENFVTYFNMDFEWHHSAFQSIYQIINDREKFSIDSQTCYELNVNDYLSQENDFEHTTEVLDDPSAFIEYCARHLTLLESTCFAYDSKENFALEEIKGVYHVLGHSVTRRVFCTKRNGEAVAYAVAECFPDSLNVNNHLDSLRVYFLEDNFNGEDVLGSILSEANLFFRINHRGKFRVYLQSSVDKLDPMNLLGLGQGFKAVRILMNKEGILEFVRLLMANFEYYTKFYNLSQPQKSIWLTEKVFPGSSIGNIAGTLKIKAELDVDLFEKAINLFVEKNDAMRIRIVMENDNVKQYISHYNYFKVELLDFSDSDINEYYKWDEEQTRKAFALYDSALYYFAIIKLGMNQYAFYAKTHHIISDAWTMNLIISQVTKYYKGLKNSEKISKAKKPSYLDYVLSEEEYKFSEKYERNREFWCKKFETMPEFMSFKTDINAKSIMANRKTFLLPEKVSKNVQSFCKKMKTSVFSLFFSVLSLYISRETGCEDIVIGTPILNRSGIKEKETVGMFINSIPVRLQVNHNMEFASYLNYVTNELNACLKNQKYNYDMILSDFRSKHKVSHKLYDVVISYQNSKYQKNGQADEMEARWHFNYNQIDSLNVHFDDREDDGQYLIKFDYLVDVFSADEIETIFCYFKKLIEEAMMNPECMLKDLNMFQEEQNLKLMEFIKNYNNTEAAYPQNKAIHQIFEEQVEKTPKHIALELDEDKITYAELNEKSNQLARRLREKGIKGDSVVALMLDRSFEMIIGILGIIKAGGAYLPIDPGYPHDRITYMLENSEVDILLTDKKYIDTISFPVESINLSNDNLYIGNSRNLKCINNPNNLVYIIYTSGSTGKPKGVMITHQGLVNYITWADKMYVRGDKAAFALYSSISFDLTVTSIFTPLISGNKIVIYNSGDNEPIIRKIFKEKKVRVVKLTPAHLQLVKDLDNKDSSIKRLILGGEDLKVELCREIHESFDGKIEIFNEYGPTETVVGCMIYKYDHEKDYRVSVPIGVPADNVQIYLLDRYLNPVPFGVPGEMHISGDGVARGYINRNKLTNERFIENPFIQGKRMYKSGDLAVMLPDGNMEYSGRIDNQTKINGFRIELGEIESEILKNKSVMSAVVLDLKDISGRKYLCAYIVKKGDIRIEDLKNSLKKVLPGYMIPASFVFMENIPLTSNGKVDRKALENIKPSHNELSEYVAPTDELEEYLESIACEILGSERVSIEDDFFEIGFDSLSIMNIVSKLMEKGWELTMQDIYDYNTIKALAGRLRSNINAELYAAAALEEIETEKNSTEHLLVPDKIITAEFKHIFLTGVTGFFGIHVFEELVNNSNVKISCLVRGQDNNHAKDRLMDMLDFYFPKKYRTIDENRVTVLAGDITEEKFGLSNSEYIMLADEIDAIFHIGALVKLFGNYEDLEKVNVEGTRRIVDFASEYGKALRYASTISVSGNYLVKQDFNKPNFSEGNFYIGQNIKDNVYVRSKFEAEKIIMERAASELDVKIFRIGDLTNRYTDGAFQLKAMDKFTFQIMRSLIEVGIIPEQILAEEIEFSPVDYASKAFVLLSSVQNKGTSVFHLFNNKKFTVREFFFEILEPMGYRFNVLKNYSFSKYIEYIKEKSDKTKEIAFLANNFNYDYMFSEKYKVNLKSEYTVEYLRRLGFDWPEMDKVYLSKTICNLRNRGFLHNSIA